MCLKSLTATKHITSMLVYTALLRCFIKQQGANMTIPQDKLIRILEDVFITIIFLLTATALIYSFYLYYLLGKALGII